MLTMSNSSTTDAMEPIAVVGLGCRFPGSATSPVALWEMLREGQSAWSEIPEERMNIASYFHPSGNRQGTVPFMSAHFIDEDVRVFDTSFFSIPADEARAIDPQQRILLEVSVEALDSAGVDRDALRKSDTGVWVGSFVKDYEQIVLRDPDDSPKYGATGNGIAIMSNRISYFLDVNGPSMTIDTGCSASLVCVHNACQSLRNGEIDVGLAGGAGLILTPNTMMPMTALNFLSPDGKCFTFDARANGYGRGEGIGIVVLKRLTDAIRDNDNIRGVIRGSNVNQDGRTPGITLPSSEAQLRNIRTVYKRAGLPVDKTAFVECHGTGTQAGDFREVKAISDAFCGDRTSDNPIYVGSIKTNIGHLEGCAGIAGLIKGVLAIEQGIIPKHLNFELPGNPAIKFEDWKVKVPVTNTAWPVEGLRRASINCFGFGGTNAHVIMDDAAHYLAERGLVAHHNTATLDLPSHEAEVVHLDDTMREDVMSARDIEITRRDSQSHLFVFSAHEQKVLSQMLKDCGSYMSERVGSVPANVMENLAYTLGCRRTKLPWRASVTAQSPSDLVQKLADLRSSDFVRALDEKATKLAFVFGGQGAQWFAMGRELLGFDIFLKSIVEADSYLRARSDRSFNLIKELLEDEVSSNINRPEISQPATTAIQIALVDMLMKFFGIIPSYVCGHSSGEIAAAYALGALSREDALELAYQRGRCAGAMLPSQENEGTSNGSMLAVGLSAREAQKYVEQVGSSRAVVACINSPTSVTLSGDRDAILELQASFQAAGIFNRLLVVSIAYHSHHMKRCEAEYLRSIKHIVPREPSIGLVPHPHAQGRLVTADDINLDAGVTDPSSTAEPCVMYSSVTGCPIGWEELGPQYWVRNMVSPVLFADAMHHMLKSKTEKPTTILEVSPHSTLQGPVKQILDAEEKLGQRPAYYSTLRRGKDAVATALEAVGKLWGHGCEVSMPWVVMRNLQAGRPKLLVDLPKYPWNHDNVYWYESHLSRANRFQVHGRYDLIGRPTADSIPFQPRWRGFLRQSETPWIRDHQVQKTMIYPAAGMVTMVLEAAKQVASDGFAGIEITRFRIQKAMIIPGTSHGLEYALNLNKQSSDPAGSAVIGAESCVPTATSNTFEFFIYSKQLDGPWEEHGDGFVTIHRSCSDDGARAQHQVRKERLSQANKHYQSYVDANNSCDELVIPRQLYETLDVIGMNYGPLFQNISSLRKRDNTCVSIVRVPDTKSVMPANFEYPHILHPATLDSIFQTAFAIGSDPMVPSFIGSLYLSAESDMLSKTGQELAVRTQADLRSLRDASASFVVADDSWLGNASPQNHPLIVIKDMTFTALASALTGGENGFLPNHHNLCSEIVWEPLSDPSNDTEGDTFTQNVFSMEPKNRVLILVPGGVDVGLGMLCSAFANLFDCDLRTLSGIKNDEQLPEFCISLLEADGEPLVWNWSEQDFLAFRTVVTATKGIFWITRGSQLEASNPQSCLIQALGRTIQSEYPTKKLISFDVDVDTDISLESSIKMIIDLFGRSFFGPKTGSPTETEYVERKGKVMVPRLVLVEKLNSLIERGCAPAEPILQSIQDPHERPLKLEIGKLGDAGSLYWRDDPDVNLPLSPYDVKIRVLMSTLTELDDDVLQGRTRDGHLGTDVYGIVEYVGLGVRSGIVVGDHAVGIARGGLRDFVVCDGNLVHKASADLRPHFPTCSSVANYAIGIPDVDDVVLVHAGAGSFGRAAIQVAQRWNVTVLATAETNGQRAILSTLLKLPEEHILDARAENFVDQIMHLTKNKGVDLIFDPAASSRDSNIRCIGEGGRVFGFANKPSQNTAAHQAEVAGKSFRYTIIDVPSLIKNQPELLGQSLRTEYPLLVHSIKGPDSTSEYDYSELQNAFAAMDLYKARDQIRCRRPTAPKKIRTIPQPRRPTSDYLHDDATYVLSGGFGGLGIEIAKLLAVNGAKHIAFLSRSGAKSELASSCLTLLRDRGVDVRDFKVDICDSQALEKVSREISESMPPVKGLFQCAAVLRDSVFENMAYDDWRLAIKPKTLGSWNLHRVLGGQLDFFIFLSSSAGVIGNRGQANYTAGNAFQDILARHINTERRGTTHAVSIDLGPILEAGMLAEDPQLLDILKASGFFGIRLQDFKRIVECAITGQIEDGLETPAQIVTGVGTGGLIRQNKPADPYWTRTSLFTHLNDVDMPEGWATISDENSDSQNSMQQMLAQATDAEAEEVIVTKGLQEMLSKSMNMDPSDVEVSRPPSAYGVDSLVAVGVRNWVSRECSADVSIFEVLSDTSISKLSAMIVERRGTQ